MTMRRSCICLAVILVLCIRLLPLSVHAQTATDITPLLSTYTQKLDDYRAQESLYYVATQQYYTLKTLASEQDAVNQTRTVLLARVDAVLAYLKILHTILDTYPGIEISRKVLVISQMDTMIETLNTHRSNTQIALDRISVEKEAVNFENQQTPLTQIVYSALMLIKLGGVQSSFDELKTLKTQIDSYISTADISDTLRQQKQLGDQELGRTIDGIQQSLTTALAEYDKDSTHADSGSLHSVESDLDSAFSGLNQSSQFSKELIQ